MEFVRKWMAQVNSQLAALSVSQKLLIGTVLIIMLMALFLVAQYAASPEMVKLPVQTATPEQVAAITSRLDARGIDSRVVGAGILVPAEQLREVMADLAQEQLLPDDTSRGFDEIVEKQNWWYSNKQNDQMWLVAKQKVLASVIRRMPGVGHATVIISVAEKKGFGTTHTRPTAAVNVVMKTGKLDQKNVDAIAGLVSGATAGMTPQDVSVIDATAGRQWKVRDPDEVIPSDYLEYLRALERHYQTKLAEALQFIPGVIVSVNVEFDPTRKQTARVTYDRDKSVELLTRQRSSTTTSEDQASGGEAGARPNTTATIFPGGATGRTSSSEEREAEFQPFASSTQETAVSPSGVPTRINATVHVPRSYFEAIHMQGKPQDAPAPTDEVLDPLITDRLAQIKEQVETLLCAKDPSTVIAAVFPDTVQDPMEHVERAGTGAGGGMLVGDYIKPLGLGVLAALSLAMMLLMVRRAARQPRMPDARELAGLPPSLGANDVIGEVEETEPALTGVELDEDEIRARKIAEQVAEMVRGKPGDAAALLGRWARTEE